MLFRSLLGRAGLWKESDELLQAALARSHSPFYLMSQLAGNAKKQGKTAEALRFVGFEATLQASEAQEASKAFFSDNVSVGSFTTSAGDP